MAKPYDEVSGADCTLVSTEPWVASVTLPILAACLDATQRVIANRLGVTRHQLEAAVAAEVDTCGTLLVARDVPVDTQVVQL